MRHPGRRAGHAPVADDQTLPKALIPINGRPFADYQLTWLSRQGITDVVYCIGYLGAQIRAAIGDGSRFGLAVRYADEGDDLKGTGGALRGALDAGLLAETFFVLYGDFFLPCSSRRSSRRSAPPDAGR
jgi:MurNAc alpha-1-phosphate uridylyltransferase